jgi:3'-5' exonuclease
MQDIANILFLDIETVSAYPTFDQVPEVFQDLWRHKAESLVKTEEGLSEEALAASYQDRAAIYAEYGKIMCISVGAVYRDADKQLRVRLKSFAGDDERQILLDFSEMMNQYYQNPAKHGICGHNIKEFDVPYICRRMVVNNLPFPALLDLEGKKPWETLHLIDTMEMWKFGDRKSYTSLKTLAAVLDFPSPKDDIDGSMVGRVYWQEKDTERISLYCEKDVLATIQCYLRLRRQPILGEGQISHVRNG